jgi:hypothetical protein
VGLTITSAASPLLLQTYDKERRAHAADMIRHTRSVQRFPKLRGGLRKALWGLLYVVGRHLRSISAIDSKQAADYGQ